MKKIFILTAVTLLFCSLQTFAALDLELTQGVMQAKPIAIVPFANEDASMSPVVTKVVSADLQNSGQFSVDYADALVNPPHTADAIDYSSWKNQKIDDVIVGKIDRTFNGYTVRFQLIDIYNQSVLLDQKLSCPASKLRALAHSISDIVYKQLTGIRGIFSTKIAYVLVERKAGSPTKYSLMVADQDGYNQQAVFVSHDPMMSPAWSPDGKELAYVSFEGKRARIYIQNLASGSRYIASQFPGINGAPAWSPDGSKLALVLTKTGVPKIYQLDLRTKSLKQLTFGQSLDTEPCWSPDGKAIVFTSSREGSPQIFKLDLASNKVTRLTFDGRYNARASFTADGKTIVMLHEADGMFNIATLDLQNGHIEILTRSGLDESPSVAPNGGVVVYATNYGGRGILGEVSIDGNVKLRLPAEEGEVQEPAWSPFLS